MGSLAPVSHWLPQDDLLLKQCIEDGASLESLARGAKRFSRRFTLQELQERWYSLLYDPVVSAEASVNMFELDRYASTAQSKSNKEAKCMSGKRKAESVHRYYYSMRKRICNDPFDLMDMDFLAGTGYCDTGNRNEPSSSDCFIGDKVSNSFGDPKPFFGGNGHAFPELHAIEATSSGYGISVSTFHGELCDPNGSTQKGCPTFCENFTVPSDQIQNAVEDFVPYEGSLGLDVKHSPTFCQHNDEGMDASSGFGCEVLNSSASACGTSPHNFGCSPVSEMPSWSAIEGFSEPTLPDALGHREQPERKELGDPDDTNGMTMPEDGTMCSLSADLKGQMACDNMNGSAANAEEYLMELSNSLLNCTEDELLFIDADGSDMIDTTYMENLSSLLLDIPDESDMSNVGLSETPVALHDHIKTSSGAHGGESGAKGLYGRVDHHLVGSSEAQKLSSALKVNPAFPELRNGVICCVLNTEDPEIPNNDDVFLPFRMPSMTSCLGDTDFDTARYPLASNVNKLPTTSKAANTPIKGETSRCELPSSLTVPFKPEVGSGAQTNTHGGKCEQSNSEGPTLGGFTHCSNNRTATGPVKECMAISEPPKMLNHDSPDSLLPRHDRASDPHLRFQKNGAGSNWELSTVSVAQNSEALHTQQQCIAKKVPDSITDFPMSDEEELSCDSDGDMPYCSDVEAMILDMDLIPDDEDLYSCQGVLRYQNDDAKRVIMRLEQAADSCIQRAISAHGALAVLYGRHSKHFIKKTEVLLGRATEDVKVDIDLGKEAHANKISRRQATMKMDIDGSFHLKNYGKQSIYVNGKEIVSGEDVTLASGSLLEVRGISFIFEINRAYVKQIANETATTRARTASGC